MKRRTVLLLLGDFRSKKTTHPSVFFEKRRHWGQSPTQIKELMGRRGGAEPIILGNSLAVNGRHDLVMMYIKSLKDICVFIESGAKIMIDNGWMETDGSFTKEMLADTKKSGMIIDDKLFKRLKMKQDNLWKGVPTVPDYQEISDHHEAKEVMKNYLETVIDHVEEKTSVKKQRTGETIQKAKEILDDPKFINQKGIRSIIDEDARVGRKSKTQDFFGYKTEFVMRQTNRIITSVRTANGSYCLLKPNPWHQLMTSIKLS